MRYKVLLRKSDESFAVSVPGLPEVDKIDVRDDNVIGCHHTRLPMIKTSTMTLRVSDELKAKLDRYAQLTGRSMSYVAATAVEEYLSWRVPQLEDLEHAIKGADAGKFASPEEVERVFRKYGG